MFQKPIQYLLALSMLALTPSMAMGDVVKTPETLPNIPATAVQNFDHRYVIFLSGIRSESSENEEPLNGDFVFIKNALRLSGYQEEQFVYFSYSAATNITGGINIMCAGWGSDGCSSNPDDAFTDLSSLNLSPQYEESDTKISVKRQAVALNWLIGQVLKNDPEAEIDLIGFSLGGITASYWAATNIENDYVENVRSLILINSPVGGIPAANGVVHKTSDSPVDAAIIKLLIISYGDIVLKELQLTVHGVNDETIVDNMRKAPCKIPIVSIESKSDYMVNGETLPMIIGDGTSFGRGTKDWLGKSKDLHDVMLGGEDVPAKLPASWDVGISKYVSNNHNAA